MSRDLVTCPKCKGSGMIRCPKCSGFRDPITFLADAMVGGKEACPLCDDSKQIRCGVCDGAGEVLDDD